MIRTRDEQRATKHRAYPVSVHANPGKQKQVAEILPHWQRGMVHVQMLQVRALRRGAPIRLLDTKHLPGYLSQRQWKSVVNQVNAGLRSWAELMVIEVRKELAALDLPDERLHELRRRSKGYQWWQDDTLAPIASKVARTRLPLPNFSRTRTMCMDGPIAQLEHSRTGEFDWWVRVSLTPGQRPVRLPLRSTPPLDQSEGEIRNLCQVRVRDDGTLDLKLVSAAPKAKPRTDGELIGLDWGLVNLLTASDGRRYGQRIYTWLRNRDRELVELQASLQRQGIKPSNSRRYRRLNQRIRDYVANEVGRILNRIGDDRIREIAVEHLDFRGRDQFSRTLRRLVSRSGRAVLKRRLSALTEDRGITVTRVSAQYTSQTCSGCGYTDPANRTTQHRFRCRFCGKTLHADVNAARNIRQRRSLPVASPYTSKQQVLAHLDQEFTARWAVDPDRVRERQSRPRSRASSHPPGWEGKRAA